VSMAGSWLKRLSRKGVPYYVNLGSGESRWHEPEAGEVYDVGVDGKLVRIMRG
jgi:hypothetical protein